MRGGPFMRTIAGEDVPPCDPRSDRGVPLRELLDLMTRAFPARAGVFLTPVIQPLTRSGVPRAGGGVPCQYDREGEELQVHIPRDLP